MNGNTDLLTLLPCSDPFHGSNPSAPVTKPKLPGPC